MALYHEYSIPTYITRRYSPSGEKIRDYEMIVNYWFPSLPVFAASGDNPDNSSVDGAVNDSPQPGRLFNLHGIAVSDLVDYGNWPSISPGIYIWKNDTESRKIFIK